MKIALLTTDSREHYGDYANPRPYFGTAPEALLAGFASLPDLEVHVISCLQQPVSSPEKIGPNIFYHGLVVPKAGWLRTGYQGCIRATRRKLREIQPDIVHGQGTERNCAISAVFSGFPNVVTIHGNMQAVARLYGLRGGGFFWLAAQLETFTLRRTAGVFCNSAYTENLVAPRARQTWRVANALRPAFFDPPASMPRPEKPVLLNIGVVEPRKQQVELLALAHRLHQRGLRFELQFIGHRADHPGYCEQFARALVVGEATGYARHLGLLSAEQLITALDAASAVVHFPTEEAFGLVVAEALARNRKFFGAATGGIVDIATAVDGAELISPGDFTALETAIANWLTAGCPQPANAAAVMRERYHPLVIAEQHREIYAAVPAATK